MRRGIFAPSLLMLPALGVLTLIIVVPSLIALAQSLTNASLGRAGEFVGLDNYARILSDRAFWTAALNTFILVNVVVYGELLLGLGLAVLVAGWMPLRGVLVTLLIVPYAVSEVSAIVMWRYLFEPDVGLFNWLLLQMSGSQLLWPVRPLHGMILISAVSIWLTLPFTFLILYSAIRAVPRDLAEAAVVDGASRFQIFRYVTLQVIKPAILIAVLFRYIFAMRIFAEVWLLTGGGPGGQTEVLSTYLYRMGFRYQETGIASATGWIMMILSMAISAYYLYRMYRSGRVNA